MDWHGAMILTVGDAQFRFGAVVGALITFLAVALVVYLVFVLPMNMYRERELDPLMRVLDSTLEIDPDSASAAEVEEFQRVVHSIYELGMKASRLLDMVPFDKIGHPFRYFQGQRHRFDHVVASTG